MVAGGGVVAGEPMDVCVPPATSATSGRLLRPPHRRAHRPAAGRRQREQRARRLHRDRALRHQRPAVRHHAVAVDGHPDLHQPRAAALRADGRLRAGARLDGAPGSRRALPGRPRHLRQDPRSSSAPTTWATTSRSPPSARCSARPATCSTRTPRSRGRSPSGCASATRCWSSRPRTGRSSARTSTRPSPSSPTTTSCRTACAS